MNPDKFTHKTNEALAGAHELALNSGHAQLTPLHLAVALVSDPSGILSQAIASSGGENAHKEVETVFKRALKKLPSQSPAPDEVPASTTLIKVIRRAQAAQKSRGDTHLAVDQLVLGLLEDSQIGDLLKEAGVTTAKVKSEVEKLRGKEGKKVESASGDTTFQALKTYGRATSRNHTDPDVLPKTQRLTDHELKNTVTRGVPPHLKRGWACAHCDAHFEHRQTQDQVQDHLHAMHDTEGPNEKDMIHFFSRDLFEPLEEKCCV